MNLQEVVNGLCEALDARHTGCEIELVGDSLRVVRTFSYASAKDLLITDVLRAVATPDWRQALADAQAALLDRIDSYEARRALEEAKRGIRLGLRLPSSGAAQD